MRQNNINCTHYFSTYQIFFTFSCGEFFPHDNLSCGEFLHLTICHVDKFLHMTKKFSTGTARGARDKYEVCCTTTPTQSALSLSSSLLHPVALLIGYWDYDRVHKQYSELTIKMNIIKKCNQLSQLSQVQVQASPRLRRQLPRDRGQHGRRGGWSARRHAGQLFLMCLRRGNPCLPGGDGRRWRRWAPWCNRCASNPGELLPWGVGLATLAFVWGDGESRLENLLLVMQ